MPQHSAKLARLKYPWQKLVNFLKHFSIRESLSNSPLKRELSAVFILALSLIVGLALLTFSPVDINKPLGDDFDNWLGPIGAWLSLKTFTGIGIAALMLPLGGFLLSFYLFVGREPILWSMRAWGATIVVTSCLTLLALMKTSPINNTYLIGGVFGQWLSRTILLYVGKGGFFIINACAILSGVALIMHRPFINRMTKKLVHLCKRADTSTHKGRIAMLKPVETNPPTITNLPPIYFPPSENASSLMMLDPVEMVKAKSPTLVPDIQIVERDIEASATAVKTAERESVKKEYSFTLPPLNLLDYDAPQEQEVDSALLKKEADKLQRAFLQFGIEGKIREIRPGPVVTNYEFVPAPGIKLSRIAALSDDIAMAMSAVQVRIVTPIPGKGAVGIEVPNERRETVYLKEIVADQRYRQVSHKLCMAIGKDVEGNPYFMNLADMPHVLIAGTTGSGKSVSVNAMICSILYRATPNDVRFLMIDPKMLELSIYNGIPHLLLPPIIDPKKAANALKWAVKEMDQRYALMKEATVRDIATYNEKLKVGDAKSLPDVGNRKHEHLPFIVIVIDEYADLLAVAGKEVENLVMRLAQKARASGIHVMLATQRPSVDVITGVIKANFPVRMGFRLSSSHDSKTIVNKTGAEKLLGRGDVLIMPPGTSDLFRVHGAFISEKELSRVVEFLSAQKTPEYRQEIVDCVEEEDFVADDDNDKSASDEKFLEALAIVREHQKCSTSFIQRHLSIGYNRAARIVEHMEKKGLVGPVLNARGEREIFLTPNQ